MVSNPGQGKALVFSFILAFAGLLFFTSSSSQLFLYSQETVDQAEFEAYQKTYSKSYSGDLDERFSVFQKNLAFIREQNSKNGDWVLGVNSFADQTPGEFKSRFLAITPSQRLEPQSDVQDSIPSSVNWVTAGAVTPVGTQGNCASHWAFSAAGAIEGIWKISGNPLTALSVQQLVDCSSAFGNYGCNGGLMDFAFSYVINNTGIASAAKYPYVGLQSSGCNKTLASQNVANISNYTDVQSNSSSALLAAISKQPVSVAVEADQSIWQFYRGGIVSRNCGLLLDHGALAVGYSLDSTPAYYLVKNSWGPDWGENGYIRLAVIDGPGVCGIQMEPSYPTI